MATMGTAITKLLDKAKDAIAAGESSLRKAAELIAQAQDAGAKQRQIAKRVGKSQSWVHQLLAWRKAGYSGGAFERSHKARSISRANQAKVPNKRLTPEAAAAMQARAEAVARLFPPAFKPIPKAARVELIAALKAYASPLVETIRKRLNLTWDDLIVPAATDHENSSTLRVAPVERSRRYASAA